MFCLFSEFPVQKNDPKIKVLRMPWKFYMIFPEYLRIFGAKITRGGAPGGHNPPGRARTPRRTLVGCGPHVGPLTYLFTPHHHLPPEKILHCSLSRVLALKPADFDLFAQSSVSETVSGICCLVYDSSMCPISFCFSGLYLEKLATLGAVVDELACWILRVLSSLNAWYGLYASLWVVAINFVKFCWEKLAD